MADVSTRKVAGSARCKLEGSSIWLHIWGDVKQSASGDYLRPELIGRRVDAEVALGADRISPIRGSIVNILATDIRTGPRVGVTVVFAPVGRAARGGERSGRVAHEAELELGGIIGLANGLERAVPVGRP